MTKITKEQCVELLIKSGCAKGHIIEYKPKERHIQCGDVYVCRGCHQYARFKHSEWKSQVWSPWEGTLIHWDNVTQGIRQHPVMDDKECWNIDYQIKHLKDRLRRRIVAREVVDKITNKLSRQEVEAIINALMWDVDFEEVPENDGSEKRDDWPHAMPELREAA